MIVAIHQPNFLPWLGYFYKIAKSDIFVLMDNVQFPRGRSFCHRNRIKTPRGALWLSVPISRDRIDLETQISEIKIDNSQNWQNRHWKTVIANYSKATYFNEYKNIFEDIFRTRWDRLVDLNESLIRRIIDILGITHIKLVRMSELDVSGKGTALLIDICKKLEGTVYISGEGGRKYMEEDMFEREGITLEYAHFVHPEYQQLWGVFIPNLSILDLIFNEGNKSLNIILSGGPEKRNDGLP
jgi:hypothetical protein